MTTMTRIDYAKHAGVDRKTIGRWIKAGRYIVLDGDDINVEESDKALALLRNSKDGRTTNAAKSKKPVSAPAIAPADNGTAAAVTAIMMATGAEMSKEEASRVKENYLALMAKLEYEKQSEQVIEMAVAETAFFEEFRAQRDSWLNWPQKVAPLMAADLDIPADRMTEVLIAYVHKHITGLGEPEFNTEQD